MIAAILNSEIPLLSMDRRGICLETIYPFIIPPLTIIVKYSFEVILAGWIFALFATTVKPVAGIGEVGMKTNTYLPSGSMVFQAV